MRIVATVLALAFAGAAAADVAQQRIETFTSGLQGLDGRFEQHVFDSNGELSESSTGRVALAAPRQFRWEYEQPFPQLIVADGERVFVYDPDLEQVSIRPQASEEQQSPLAALVDPEEMARQFTLRDGGTRDGYEWVELLPNSDEAQISSCLLGFDGAELRRMELADALGQRTEVAFHGWSRNPEFPAGTFSFTPPPGVDVIGELEPAAEVYPLQDQPSVSHDREAIGLPESSDPT